MNPPPAQPEAEGPGGLDALQRKRQARLLAFITASVLLVVVVCVVYAWFDRDPEEYPEGTIRVRMEMRDARYNPHLTRRPDGSHVWSITNEDGSRSELNAEEFSARLYEEIHAAPWWAQVFNISSPLGMLWVAIGLLGQVLFTGRMVVQWVASERAHQSVVPAAFWWMSLIGATMLLSYFIWRKDLVGVLGQGTGWLIYVRNLYLIYRWKRAPSIAEDVDAEPSLESRA
jgi:lipid-A-disaccharide synthase-like uncharacterized protein